MPVTTGFFQRRASWAGSAKWHSAILWRAGLTADLPPVISGGYRVVVASALYPVEEAVAANLMRYVDGGGTLVVGPYGNLMDQRDQLWPARLPGALANLLGVRVESSTRCVPVRASRWTTAAPVRCGRKEAIHAVNAESFAGTPAVLWPAARR